MKTVPSRRVVSGLLTFLVISTALVFVDRQGWVDPVRDGLGEVLSPIAVRVSDAVRGTTPRNDLEVAYATVVAERNEAVAENARLKSELEEVEALRLQNEAERQRPDITYVPAKVIGSDPAGLQRAVIIDRGTADGLRVGMAVVDPYMYIGQITEVQERQARVLLLTDTNASVGAMLYDARADGVVYGMRSNVLTMRHVDKDVAPGEMEWVVTSDIASSETALVPPNIPVGIVIGEPQLDAQNDQLELTIQPGANIDELTTVWIAVPND